MFAYRVVAWGIVASVLAWTVRVLAAEVPQKKAEPSRQKTHKAQDLLPAANLYTSEEMRQGFDRQQITPFGNPKLYLEIVVPKDWDSRPLEVPPEILAADHQHLVPMAKLTPNSGENASIEVHYIRASPAVALDKLVETYAKASGATFVARQRGEFNDRKVEDALLRWETTEFGPILTRFTASRRGDYILVVACSTTETLYPKFKRVFGFAAVTFDPSGK